MVTHGLGLAPSGKSRFKLQPVSIDIGVEEENSESRLILSKIIEGV